MDRRVQRTQQLLRQALADLILTKRYDKITVQEIIDKANVGRSTFYAHFQDKEDLLASSFAELASDLNRHLREETHPPDEMHLVHSMHFFEHAEVHHQLYQAMIEGGGSDFLVETVRQYIHASIETHFAVFWSKTRPFPIPLPALAHYLAGALLSLLMWWLRAERPYTPAQMEAMFEALAQPGIQQLSGHAA